MPLRQAALRHSHAEFDPLPLLRAASVSAHQLFRLVRRICRETEANGGDWREAITFVRTLAPRLWSKLPDRERRRFLRHARAYWDVHRHRLPPDTRSTIDELRASQRLMVHAGRIVRLEPEANQVRVTWRDSCLGLPAPELCAQVLTPGYSVTLSAGGRRCVYNTDLRRLFRYAGCRR